MTGPSLEGRVALVTGAAQGMGAASAIRLGEEGAKLLLLDLQREKLESTLVNLRERGRDVEAFCGNVVEPGLCASAVERAVARWGRLDILVHAAGILRSTRALEISEEEWDLVIAVNLKGAFLMSQAATRAMKVGGWGRIVHFSSTAGKTVSTLGGCHYTASKHAVLGLTRALAKELAPFGITVNAVCPGLIDTEMVRASMPASHALGLAAAFPLARLGTPQEVAELVCFLAGPAAGYITGAALDINGGDLMV